MKFTVRRGVFETNSSSVHSFTIADKEDYDKFKKGELYIHRYDLNFCTKEQYIEENKKWLSEEDIKEILECKVIMDMTVRENGYLQLSFFMI